MSASDHINPDQLGMFMQAGDIVKNYKIADDPWDYKLKQAKGNHSRKNRSGGLYDKIAAEGIRDPVHLFESDHHGQEMGDGHHRVAVANDLDPHTEVPVMHETWTQEERFHSRMGM